MVQTRTRLHPFFAIFIILDLVDLDDFFFNFDASNALAEHFL